MRNRKLKVFIAERDQQLKEKIIDRVESKGHHAKGFTSTDACIVNLHKKPDVILLGNLSENPLQTSDLVFQIKNESPKSEVVMLSNKESLELAVRALKNGASDFFVKDTDMLTRVSSLLNKTSQKPVIKRGFAHKFKKLALPALGLAAIASSFFIID